MEKISPLRFACFVLVAGIVGFTDCKKQSSHENGTLKGVISIGPICPVERNPPDPACQPTAETYKAYPVYVCTPDGSSKIELISPALDGTYIITLPAGSYRIVLDKAQTGPGSNNLPAQISINASDTTKLNISIDTGIR